MKVMTIRFLIATALLISGALITPGSAIAQIVHPTCAETWLKSHNPSSSAAKAAGQACILAGKPTVQQISRPEAQSLLVKYITPKTDFVAKPPKDISDFCPKYAALNGESQATMWRNLFLAMIPFESAFNNASLMLDGDQYSIGLYQMSVTDGCGLKREAELVDPDKNTACAVAKMGRLASPGAISAPWAGVIGGDAAHISDGAARYWRTLRTQGGTHGANQPSRAAMIKASQSTPGCT
jgi:hypothetical protein